MRVPPRLYILDKFTIPVPITGYLQTEKVSEKLGKEITSLHVDNKYFNGYWQNPDLYSFKLTEEFQNRFHVKSKYYTDDFLGWLDIIQKSNAVALHVRRGDYLMHPNHLVLPLRYYKNALEYMGAIRKDIAVFIFSDDIE
jgi:hypothetical protein